MLGAVVAWFKEAPDAKRLEDPKEVDATYARYRTEALLGSMVAYALFYLLRKNLSVAAPLIATELHYTNDDLGTLNGYLYITYGVSKFLSGLVADRASPRALMVTGLLASVAASFVFGSSSLLGVFAVTWALNGVFQSTGAPASAKVVATWFGALERGTKTGIWNISHQAGGGLALLVAGAFAHFLGWRWCFYGPGLIVLAGTIAVARFLHDRPETRGLPPVEIHRGEPTHQEDEARATPFSELLVKGVLLNPRVWIIALASGCTYVARVGALDWSPKYLVDVRHAPIGNASVFASLLEFIGIPGMLFCAWLSDRLGARRAPVACGSLVLLSLSILALVNVPPGHAWLDATMLGVVGFFTYGPQLLLAGVSPVDMSSKRVAAAAVGFTGLMSYLASWVCSKATGKLIDAYGWPSAFHFWALAALLGAVLCLPMWRKAPGRA